MKTIIWTILVDYPLSMPDIVRRSTRAVSQMAHCCLRPSGVSSQNLGRARHGPFFLSWQSVHGSGRGCYAIANSERALHEDAVDPAAELEPNGAKLADADEPQGLVQSDRRVIG